MNVLTKLFTASLGLLLGLMAVPGSEGFAQARVLAVDDLAKRAEVVAVGRVSAMKSEWSADQTHIVTRVTIAVEQYVKGQDATSVTITTLGGEVGEVGELYTHVPTFQPNESVVVFLKKDREGEFRVTGGTEGKYAIGRHPDTGERVVAGNRRLSEFTDSIRQALQD